MSLLDDVSIVVTPNGYKAGTLFAVKPTDVLGSEEITNGDFSNDLTDWTENGGSYATIVSGALNSNNPDAGNWYAENISQNVSFVNGTTYKLTFKAKNISGNLNLRITQGANPMVSLDLTSTFVDYTYFYTANADNGSIRIFCNSAVGQFQIDDISVKEWTGADMDVTRATAATRVDENGLVNYAEVIGGEEITNGNFENDSDWVIYPLGVGWTIANNVASFDGSSTVNPIYQSVPLTSGTTYKFSFKVINYVSGSFKGYLSEGQQLGFTDLITSNGDYTFYITSIGTLCLFRSVTNFIGSITNVSVKEVTRDNVPRIDYTGGGCPHILAEPQRTNLVTYSEVLNSTAGVVLSDTISPDGTLNGLKLTETTDNSLHYGTAHSASVVNGTTYTVSFYIKKGTYDEVTVYTYSSHINASVKVEFSTESTNLTGGIAGSNFMEDSGNGWYRVGFSGVAIATGTMPIFLPTKDLSTYVGSTSQYTEYWGIQVEEGSYPTSYIPTSGSTVTRNQDIFTRDGIGSLINSTEGVLFVEIAALSNDLTYRMILIDDGVAYTNGAINLSFNNKNNEIRYNYVNNSGVNVCDIKHTVSDETDFNKIACSWKQDEFKLYSNGVKVGETLIGDIALVDNFKSLSFDRNGNLPFYGKVKQLQVYKTALTDDTLALLTS